MKRGAHPFRCGPSESVTLPLPVNKSDFRATLTEAFAATIADDSRRGSGPAAAFDTGELPEVGDVIGGLYRLVRLLGKGMFGHVYVAQRVDVPEHQVALKLVPREVY